jgi:hypothetical protein
MLKLGAKNKRGSEVVKVDRIFFYVKVNPLDVPKCEVMNSNWSIDKEGNWVLKLRISEDGKNFKF